MSLGQIIRNKREQLNLTLEEVSREVGFSKPYLSTIETGKVKNPPSDDLLSKLEKTLQFGEGLLLHIGYMERMPSGVRDGYESVYAENKRWRQFVRNLVNAKAGKKQVESLLRKNHLNIGKGRCNVSGRIAIAVINKVCTEYPCDFDAFGSSVGSGEDYVRCPDVCDSNAFAVRVFGDSMEAKFKQGQIVIFSPEAKVEDGDDCFVVYGSGGRGDFKRVFFEKGDKVRLQPRNEKYPPKVVGLKTIKCMYKAVVRYELL